ncbi:MAG: flagellar basal body P-ring protein FlgI [Acidobacteriaceae bacterium]|nr:flagellar basal body P-ring protein FlgI [Acidobacteriaceae bacterium]
MSNVRVFRVWEYAVLLALGLGWLAVAHASDVSTPKPTLARVKDIASVDGVRGNQLVGYGIVVGLQGTGDSQQTTFPVQTLAATLLRMGVSVPPAAIRVQNMAAVFIAAELPEFADSGAKVDVTVSSAGDARSLEGGMLLMTALYGADGKIYAQAQGPLVLGGYSVQANGSTKTVNHATTGRIPLGAMVERAAPTALGTRRDFILALHEADFRSAEAMAEAINSQVPGLGAHAVDSRRIELHIAPGVDVPAALAKVESVEVPFYPKARVVVNERTGTVVIGGTVALQPVSILHGGLSVNVVTDFHVSQPSPFSSGGETKVVPQSTIEARDKPVNRIELKQGATVEELVRNLQMIGATARDVISILQAMRAAGALEAEIQVL